MAQRECGACSLCCNVLQIDELDKPAGEWCRHCRLGHGGCTIYDRRPDTCAGFGCAWLQGDLPEHWRPGASHMFAHMRDTDADRVLCIYVDPQFPDAWEQEPYFSDIKNIAVGGAAGALGFCFATCVMVGDRVATIRPRASCAPQADRA